MSNVDVDYLRSADRALRSADASIVGDDVSMRGGNRNGGDGY